MLRIVLDALPPAELSPNSRLHWSKKQKVKHQITDDIIALVKEQGWSQKPLEHAVVRFSWGMPDQRRRDPDNLLSACKTHLDALGTAGVLADDSWKNIEIQIKCFDSPKKPLTIIEVNP